MIIKGVTRGGFKYEVDTETMNDWRFIKAFAESSNSDVTVAVPAIETMFNLMLGDKGFKRIQKFVRKPNGAEPVSEIVAIMQEINDAISEQSAEIKN